MYETAKYIICGIIIFLVIVNTIVQLRKLGKVDKFFEKLKK